MARPRVISRSLIPNEAKRLALVDVYRHASTALTTRLRDVRQSIYPKPFRRKIEMNLQITDGK